MNVRRSVFRSPYLSLVTALVLAMPNIASAQDDAPKALPFALGAGIMGFLIVISIAGYIYQALALQTIAQKTGTENGWFAWIPILNLILMLNIARRPIWWIVLVFVPLVDLVIIVIVLMGIAEARNKPSWWGILWIVPPISIIVPGYLAWAD